MKTENTYGQHMPFDTFHSGGDFSSQSLVAVLKHEKGGSLDSRLLAALRRVLKPKPIIWEGRQ